MDDSNFQDLGFSFQDIVESAQDIIVVTKADSIDSPGPEIVYVNDAFVRVSGYSREEVIGKTPRILQTSCTDENARKTIREALEKKQAVRTTINNFSKSGQEYWLDICILPLKNKQGDITHFVAIQRDFTQHKILAETLEKLSKLDSLTDLYNHRSFNDCSEVEFSRAQREHEIYSILMIDIDHFKKINDNYGHAIGDAALQHVAMLCKENIRSDDIVARVGGEEFCMILPNTSKNVALSIAEKLRHVLTISPLVTGNNTIPMTISIGSAELHHDDINHKDIIERADKALYLAKNNGRDQVC